MSFFCRAVGIGSGSGKIQNWICTDSIVISIAVYGFSCCVLGGRGVGRVESGVCIVGVGGASI